MIARKEAVVIALMPLLPMAAAAFDVVETKQVQAAPAVYQVPPMTADSYVRSAALGADISGCCGGLTTFSDPEVPGIGGPPGAAPIAQSLEARIAAELPADDPRSAKLAAVGAFFEKNKLPVQALSYADGIVYDAGEITGVTDDEISVTFVDNASYRQFAGSKLGKAAHKAVGVKVSADPRQAQEARDEDIRTMLTAIGSLIAVKGIPAQLSFSPGVVYAGGVTDDEFVVTFGDPQAYQKFRKSLPKKYEGIAIRAVLAGA